ncbi:MULTISPECIES: hypothetical protein [Pseudonocardia]|uniref:Uncharacterized protein n=1 Tax=Pseudonocardia saturnea TaxID=33909 RepID=A0ABQ0S4N7_9PSEU|nr:MULTISPECIES: hypothetical protein [Pseudonocardia]BBG04000.1 hypothetical protein Pdca_52090 [Pseudonocardia autotrophica]GEC27748.1 hypothetical protein PSA01_47770 [Pseudonocardia saturnea]
MRTTTLLLSASAGALIAIGASTGAALAQPTPTPIPAPSPSPAVPAVPAAPAAAEAGFVSVSPAQVAPGGSVRVSGTCPTPPSGAPDPQVQSVVSTAFTGQESFSKTDPMAFDGTATVAPTATAGAHPVLLTCSNGSATGTVSVTAGTGPPAPPAGGGSGSGSGRSGATGGSTGSGSAGTPGGVFAVSTDTAVDEEAPADDRMSWGWIVAGVAVIVAAGGGAAAHAATRRRREEQDARGDAPTRHLPR